jgi:hypothetical protein
MRKYAIPCIISLLVGALYNIVDQIFIANASYLGSHGNAANTVVFPLTVIALAIAVMIGDGCCAFVSLNLGRKQPDIARKSVGNSIIMVIVSSLVLSAVYLAFSNQIIAMFGGTVNAETFRHSKEYFFYITMGIPFYMFGQALNPIIRADGSPKFAMASTLASQKNINLVTTSLTGKDPDEIFSKFELNEEGNQVLRCPEGHAPIKTTYYPKTGMCRALFPVNSCEGCPHREACKAKAQRKSFAVHVSGKMVQRAKYLEKLSTEEYRKLTRQRNAIEGIPSVLRRKYHIDDIPVYGLLRSRTFVICKAMAYNFVKLRHYRQRHRDNCALQPAVG